MSKLNAMVVAVLVVGACWSPSSEGQVTVSYAPNSQQISLPPNGGFSKRSGLSIVFSPHWANNYGYHPLQLTIRALAPVPVDRTVQLDLRFGSYGDRTGSMTVSQAAVLPAGSAKLDMTIDVPMYQASQWQSGGYYSWDLYIDGRLDRDLSLERNMGSFYNGNQAAERSILVAGQVKASLQPLIASNTQYELLYSRIADLPKRWLEYTAFDVVAMNAAELQAAATSNPQALLAIRRWTRSGGQLWIADVGQQWEQLREVEKLLGLKSAASDPDEDSGGGISDKEAAARGWRSIRAWPENWDGRRVIFTDRRNQSQIEARDPAEISRLTADGNYYITDDRTISVPQAKGANKAATGDSSQYFVEQPIGFGRVRLFRSDEAIAVWTSWQNLQPVGQNQTATASAQIGNVFPAVAVDESNTASANASSAAEPVAVRMAMETTPSWSERHGMAPDAPNGEFSEWLLPGVGIAPVTEFRILITLFVLVIGPLNYMLLRRMRRLYLLVVTVPLAAALLTMALFSYALISDGLETKLRVRSVTVIDQRSGEAASWARLSYYAGLAPSGGLTVSGETAIYPIVPDWYGATVAEMGVARELEWSTEGAQLTRGWLRSRTPTQYLTVRAHSSPLRLQLREGDGRLAGKNDLNTHIVYVVAADAEGKLFSGSDIASGATVDFATTEPSDMSRRLSAILRAHVPEAPPELNSASRAQYAGGLLINTPYYYYGRNGNRSGQLSDNLMQQVLDCWTKFDGDIVANIAPRSYVAVTTTGPDIELGVKNPKEEDSFHVVIGTW